MYTFGGTSEEKFYNDLWQLAIMKEGDMPPKPPRSGGSMSANAAPVPVAKKESMSASSMSSTPLEAPTPIPPKRTTYATSTAIPSGRIAVAPGTPGKVSF
jgi:hypothetical protein